MGKLHHIKNQQFFNSPSGLSKSVVKVSSEEVNFEKTMDQQCFLGQLKLEKLRSQRSGTALSLLILNLTDNMDEKSRSISGLLKTVQSKMCESDSLGYLDKDSIGVLLPYQPQVVPANRVAVPAP